MAAPIISNNDPLAYTCNGSSHDTANLLMASGAASAAATSPATTTTQENNPHHHPTTTNNPERRLHHNDKSGGGRRGSSTLGMAAQKEIWKLEQEVIAALVRVEPDPPPRPTMDDSSSNSSMLYNSVFHLIRDNHEHDMFSFSTAPELYGGVDVSFPISSRNNKTGAAASSNNTRRLFSSTSDENEDRMDDDGEDEDDDANQMQPAAAEKETMADNDETTIKDEQEEEQAVAVYVIIDRRTMTVVYHDHLFFDLEVPYIPTFLAFREIAPLEELVQRQVQHHPQVTPEAILVDGNGILHPRHAGLACFLGTRTDIPTIGIAKSLLHQDHDDNGGGGGSWTRESVDESVDEFVQKVHTMVGQNQNQPQLAHQLARHRGLIMKTISLPAPSNNNNNNNSSSSNKRHHHHHDNSTPTTSRSSSGSDGDPADDDDDVAMYPAVAAAAATNIVHSTTTSRKNGYFDRKQALQDLAPFCCGLAVPLVTAEHHADIMDDEDEDEDEDDADDTNRFPVLGCALVGHGGQIAATSHSAPHGGSSKPIFVSVGHKVSLQQSVQIAASLSLARIPEPVRQADLLGREIMRQKAAAAAAAATATSVTSTGNASPGKETKI